MSVKKTQNENGNYYNFRVIEIDATMTDVTISRQSASHSTRHGKKAPPARSLCTTAASDTGPQPKVKLPADEKAQDISTAIKMTPHGEHTG